jgi:CRISPR/Cas system CSM-associated protein Csm3 (group 7 of RAMP superfamily)
VWKFDLRNEKERLEWLRFDDADCPEASVNPSIETAIGVKLEQRDQRDRFWIDAVFQLASPLLIRAEEYSTECAPDVVQLKSYRAGELKPVLSGTSLAGVMRHRAERILRTLEKSTDRLSTLFGNEESQTAQSSRLVIHESLIEGKTAELVQSRVAIDRFTGGSFDGALFHEQALFGTDETSIRVQIELRCPKSSEIGLLLLLLKDLWTGDLTVGGSRSIGRGKLQGHTATLALHSATELTKTWAIQQDKGRLTVQDAAGLEAFVTAFVEESA